LWNVGFSASLRTRPTKLPRTQLLPLITRPTEHSGVTFGAATSVLLTGVEKCFAVRRHKKGGGNRRCQNRSGFDLQNFLWEREDKALWNVGFSASLRTRPTELQNYKKARAEGVKTEAVLTYNTTIAIYEETLVNIRKHLILKKFV
jgi:hypothetical protein